MTPLSKILLRFLESSILVMLLALAAGLLWPETFDALSPYNTLLLQGIFFLAGLKVSVRDVLGQMRRPGRILLANAFMLVIFPVAGYAAARALYPDAAIGIMLLAAMPTAMSAPLFASLAGGVESLALTLTVTTSVLAPFTVPIVVLLTVGTSVPVDTVGMLGTLAYVILLPLAVAQIVRRGLHAQVTAASFTFNQFSILLLGLLIAGVSAENAATIRASIGSSFAPILVALVLFFLATFAAGYLTAFHRSHAEQVTYAISLSYMTFVTAFFLAQEYFPDPKTILTTVLVEIPWAVTFIPFRAWALRTREVER